MLKLGRWIGRGMVIAGVSWMFSITALAGNDIKINPNCLRSLTDRLYMDTEETVVKADELFIGLDDSGFTFRELETNMARYNPSPFSVSLEEGGFSCGRIFMGIAFTDKEAVRKAENIFAEECRVNGRTFTWNYDDNPCYDIRMDKNTMVNLCMLYEDFESDRMEMDRTLFIETIEMIEQVNNSGSISSVNGWKSGSDGSLFYFENGRAVTGSKIIDGAVYYFKPEDCSMARSEFITINIAEQDQTFYFAEDGTLVTGWKQINHDGTDCWHYFTNTGVMTTGFRWIDGELYCFEENGSMIYDGFREINGHKYHFNKDWADRGWQRLEESGDTGWYYFSMEDASAMKGYVPGIEGDSFQYFFWTDGYTDQNGKTYPSGALAQGEDSSDRWVFKDGRAVYVADKDGHLYTDTQMTVGGKAYDIDGEGNVTLAHSSSEKFRQKVESVLQAYPVERTWNGEGECHGFAMNLLMKVFETDNGYREDFCSDSCSEDHGMHNKVGIKTSDIQEGDLVRITGHSFFVTEIENRADGTYIKTREAWGDKGNLIMDNEWKIVSDTELEGKPGVWNPKLKLQYIRRIKNRDSHLLFQ